LFFSFFLGLFSDEGNILFNLFERLKLILKLLKVLQKVTDVILLFFFDLSMLKIIWSYIAFMLIIEFLLFFSSELVFIIDDGVVDELKVS
jgi:hypothetical protein